MFFLFRCLKPFFFLVRLKGRHLDSMLLACKQKVHIYDFQTLCLPCCIYLLTTCVAENCREKYNLFPNYFVSLLWPMLDRRQMDGEWIEDDDEEDSRHWRDLDGSPPQTTNIDWNTPQRIWLKYTSNLKPQTTNIDWNTPQRIWQDFAFQQEFSHKSQFMSLFKCHMYHGKVDGYVGTQRSNDFDIFDTRK